VVHFSAIDGPGAQRHAIRNLDHARHYLADPILGSRLLHDVRLMMSHKGKSALEILGSPDDLKFRSGSASLCAAASCLTLFARAASDSSERAIFNDALDQFYGGDPDPRILELCATVLVCYLATVLTVHPRARWE
jgi:uncharacterized protein (DUF1810 family)